LMGYMNLEVLESVDSEAYRNICTVVRSVAILAQGNADLQSSTKG
jgi:hypothetical protein